MKKIRYIGIPMMAAAMLAATSCSDYNDYNKAELDATASANQSLWENIQQNAQLSDFAALVKKAGFDSELSATHYYTVWAPLNGTFDASAYQNLDKDALLKQFVKNHIASYGHRASGQVDERVLMLNDKSYDFTGNQSYTFNGVSVASANLPSNNGVMHTLNGTSSFYPNLYEYVTSADLAAGKELDSLRNYFLHYESTYLDTERSVLGSIVDGMQTYVDSVMVTENTLWNSLNVKMNDEDSTYTFLMPTNEAWRNTYDRIKSYYHYIIELCTAQLFNRANTPYLRVTIHHNAIFFKPRYDGMTKIRFNVGCIQCVLSDCIYGAGICCCPNFGYKYCDGQFEFFGVWCRTTKARIYECATPEKGCFVICG